jgi:hypothetical protein
LAKTGVRNDDRIDREIEDLPETDVAEMRQVNDDAQFVQTGDELPAEAREPTDTRVHLGSVRKGIAPAVREPEHP